MQKPVVEPPKILPESVDRHVYQMIHGLPHTPISDRYVTALSDLGEGLGWVAAGAALATFYPRSAPLVFALATGVALSRVHLGHHFPSDVTVGALLGMASGTAVASVLRTPRPI